MLLPLTGFGTWRLMEPQLTPAVREAVRVGYRHFDGAFIYENEEAMGAAFKTLISEGTITRSELFITSKLWVTKMRPECVRGACEESLKRWGMEYFDLYLIHWPFAFKANENGSTLYDTEGCAVIDQECSLEDTWRAMEQLVQAGLTKAIGVSNFSPTLLKRILNIPGLKIKPAVNQIELHPYLQQRELRAFCHHEGIVCEAYSSLGSGKSPSLLEDETVLQVAKNEGTSASKVLLSWARQQDIPVIPKSTNAARIADNFSHHVLSAESMQALNDIRTCHRYVDPINFWKHPMPL